MTTRPASPTGRDNAYFWEGVAAGRVLIQLCTACGNLRGRDNAYFWEGVAAGRVLIQLCTACGNLRHPPSPMCPACQSLAWTTVAATGRARLHSYTVCHHPLPPWETGPYAVVLADLAVEDSEETVRIVCGARDVALEDLVIDMPLRLVFAEGLVFVTGEET